MSLKIVFSRTLSCQLIFSACSIYFAKKLKLSYTYYIAFLLLNKVRAMKSFIKNFLIILVIFLVIASIFSAFNYQKTTTKEISIGAIVDKINSGEVDKITVSGTTLTVKLKDGSELTGHKEEGEVLSEMFKNYSTNVDELKKVNIEYKGDSTSFLLTVVMPFIIPFLLIGFFVYFIFRQVQGANTKAMSFGQSQPKEIITKGSKDRITFKDVAGVEEAKEELEEIIEFLKHPKKFTDMGARIPKGVLLLGAPGTGKTLLAKAVAGEANVPFLSISGSEFVEMFVGVGASRVRDLFRRAKKMAPCIIFVDEIDAVGRQRGAGLGGSHDEREQTLNQILVEMDGMATDANVIVMAATNRPDILDPALLRPGRFDRRVVLDMPDLKAREAIVRVHARNKPIASEVDLKKVAERTPGFSGADLSNLLNEAAISAARKNKKKITYDELYDSIEKVLLGPERKSHILTEHEKEITAYHEAGHALVSHLLPNTDPVQKISIIARGTAAGYTIKLPEIERRMHTKSEFIDDLAVLLGGYVSEKLKYKDLTTGSTNDLRVATRLSKDVITQYGMSDELGPRTFGEREEMIFLGKEIHEQRDYSEKTAERIDLEISKMIENASNTARKILTENSVMLEKVARVLIEKETLEREDFEKIVGKKRGRK